MAKILVIDDDTLLKNMYQKILEFHGHSVVVADDGEAGIGMAATEKPDLIMMDVMMPKMNGVQALKALKSDALTSQIPVVVLTNLTSVTDKDEVMAAGATAYLDKSQNEPKKIAAVVADILKPIS